MKTLICEHNDINNNEFWYIVIIFNCHEHVFQLNCPNY